ncbi:BTAD domain-containing putative transcriptional regulator [Streptomyces sp. NPDC046931]|uniref:AfsR/SARP family transcriptional regulator n=1 Tax=Streptomyces sp. NPDC046931 TaxID=3154806 RepID=UPI0034017DD7
MSSCVDDHAEEADRHDIAIKALGTLLATVDGHPVAISGPRQRTIFAMLVLARGRVVSVDSLVDAVWGVRPPTTARTQVAICIGALRKAFRAAHAKEPVILTTHPGYQLLTDFCSLDVGDFAAMTADAADSARQGRLEDAVGLYRKALGLWTGSAYCGVSGQIVEDEATRLEAERLGVYEALFDAELSLGHHNEVLPELSAIADDHPLHEKLRHSLMLAQYRCGRRAEAAEGFRIWRRRFVDEIGIEPSASIHELHNAILRDAPELALRAEAAPRPNRRAIPAELPADVPDLIGRRAELTALDALLDNMPGRPSARTGVVAGTAGVGKTSLVVHWASRAWDYFPDGLLYADLSQYEWSHEAATVHSLLHRFLRVLGISAESVPERLDECTSSYRSLLAERRALVVLDNARSLAHIQPFLPGCGDSRLLVTTDGRQDPMAVGRGTVHVDLDALPLPEAADLVTKLVGERRALDDPSAVRELCRLCGGLPLALRAAAGRLIAKPHWSVRHFVYRLTDDNRRLRELGAGGLELRDGFERGYHALTGTTARMCHMLGLLDAGHFTAYAGAALLAIGPDEAEEAIEQLVDRHLVRVVGVGPGGVLRYAFHELVRLLAREKALAEETEAERYAALARVCGPQLAAC